MIREFNKRILGKNLKPSPKNCKIVQLVYKETLNLDTFEMTFAVLVSRILQNVFDDFDCRKDRLRYEYDEASASSTTS